jgi:hypothetical protein
MMSYAPTMFDFASFVAIPCLSSEPNQRKQASETLASMGDEAVMIGWFDLGSEWGTIAIIMIPVIDVMMFEKKEETKKAVHAGINLASSMGIGTISCTGMIPAATDGLLEVEGFASETGVKLSTGHETVVVAFALNVDIALEAAGRFSLSKEHVACIGLGRIGGAHLRLQLGLKHFPASLTLVDIPSKRKVLEKLATELCTSYSFPLDRLFIVTADPLKGLPKNFYDTTTLYFGATSAADVLDINQVRPGAVIVDDSFPTCFNLNQAIQRAQQKGDFIATIAGALGSLPEIKHHLVVDTSYSVLQNSSPFPNTLTGCIASVAVLNQLNLPLSIGKPREQIILEKYYSFKAHGITGSPMYLFRFDAVQEKGPLKYQGDYLESFLARFHSKL